MTAYDPISKIRSELNTFESALGKIVGTFQVPKAIALEVLDLSYDAFEHMTGGLLDKSFWNDFQKLKDEKGASALSGLKMGPTTITVGDDYAVWNGERWTGRAELPSPQEVA